MRPFIIFVFAILKSLSRASVMLCFSGPSVAEVLDSNGVMIALAVHVLCVCVGGVMSKHLDLQRLRCFLVLVFLGSGSLVVSASADWWVAEKNGGA